MRGGYRFALRKRIGERGRSSLPIQSERRLQFGFRCKQDRDAAVNLIVVTELRLQMLDWTKIILLVGGFGIGAARRDFVLARNRPPVPPFCLP
jgi:hypothetical protein